MERIWIHFTERQAQALRKDAHNRRVPIAEIVRDLVTAHYGLERERVEPGRPYKSPDVTTS